LYIRQGKQIDRIFIRANFRRKGILIFAVFNSVAYPHRKNADADADPGKNLNADADADSDADSCPYCTMASQVLVKEIFKGTVQRDFSSFF
jgi:hypothetical protein